MAEYELAPAAERDLLEIARYTIETWGNEQATRYEAALEAHFQALGRGEVWTSAPLAHRPELIASRCEHHYVFAMRRDGTGPLVLAVLHESMDLMKRLQERPRGTRTTVRRPGPACIERGQHG